MFSWTRIRLLDNIFDDQNHRPLNFRNSLIVFFISTQHALFTITFYLFPLVYLVASPRIKTFCTNFTAYVFPRRLSHTYILYRPMHMKHSRQAFGSSISLLSVYSIYHCPLFNAWQFVMIEFMPMYSLVSNWITVFVHSCWHFVDRYPKFWLFDRLHSQVHYSLVSPVSD